MAWNRNSQRRVAKVNWKTSDSGVVEKPEPLPYQPSLAEPQITDRTRDFWESHTVPKGAMFIAVQPLALLPPHWDRAERVAPPHPYLYIGDERFNPKAVVVHAGSILTYLGEIRVEEGPSKASVRRVVRRKFLVGGQVYIVQNLDAVRCEPSAKFDPDMVH